MSNKVCITGAGFSGTAAAKILSEREIPFDCFEMGSGVGGLWRYDNETSRSPAYASLQTNTSRRRTAFSDFPMPSSYPDFPRHSQMLDYLESYVDHFGFRRRIAFRSQVEHVRPTGDGSYHVTVRDLENDTKSTEHYCAVLVATGHHWKPNVPSFPGSFSGTEMHSHAYRTPDVAAGKRVLIVGVGNSACDIVCEVSGVAARTYLSTRRGAHVIPKRLLGRPTDLWLSPLSSRLPRLLQRALFRVLIYLTQGRQKRYGFPTPEYGLDSAHPTVSTDLLPLVKRGLILPKPDVEKLLGRAVRFVGGTVEEVDLIIYATGYLTSFPFLDFIEPRDNYLPLYRHVVHPDHPNLYFLGLVQPLGAIPPLSEAQAAWIADLLEGTAALPTRDEMLRVVAREDRERRRRFVDSKRHQMEIDFYTYLRELRLERRHGRRRVPERVVSEAT